MQLFAGTSGFSYKEWLGHFYPRGLDAGEMLRYYAERLPTVEINNTFYRMPAIPMLERWVHEVPAHFAFALKAPRSITHEKRLREAGPAMTEFLRRASALGDRLAVILFQLPPFLRKDIARLRDFLDVLPASGPGFAFELRHASWQDEEVYALLRSRAVALVVTDEDTGDTSWVATASWGYLRLRRTHYAPDELGAWAQRLAAAGLERCYVYFMHEDEALGVRFAQALREAWVRLGADGKP